jgi:hypothetical protein
MEGNKKIDVDVNLLPKIKRAIVVINPLSGLTSANLKIKLAEAIIKSDRTDVIAVSENIIQDWAVENELWFDMQTWDGKKKLNEDIPT